MFAVMGLLLTFVICFTAPLYPRIPRSTPAQAAAAPANRAIRRAISNALPQQGFGYCMSSYSTVWNDIK